MVAEIGRHRHRYAGDYDGNSVHLSGPHEVRYELSQFDGLLQGAWEASGVEELIPVSPFAPHLRPVRDSSKS